MICFELGHNFQMETLNLSLTTGLTEYGVRTLMLAMYKLNSLNISWAGLKSDAITSLVTNAPINLMRLNIAGCRKVLFDSRKSQQRPVYTSAYIDLIHSLFANRCRNSAKALSSIAGTGSFGLQQSHRCRI